MVMSFWMQPSVRARVSCSFSVSMRRAGVVSTRSCWWSVLRTRSMPWVSSLDWRR